MEQALIKPEWLKVKLSAKDEFHSVKQSIKANGLHTVCEEAHCPNISECWNSGTATFMLMGDVCTRSCKFCAVKSGNPKKALDADEPRKLAKSIAEISLFDYVVLTSVTRDDLEDGGASHFAECIREVKKAYPSIIIEVLIPDFRGNIDSLKMIADAHPEVIAHNIETVERLQRKARDIRANYSQSLGVLRNAKEIGSPYTKSSIMLGIGEEDKEVIKAMEDLRNVNVDFLTIGQYMRPSSWHLPIKEYVRPEKFEYFRRKGLEMGFLYVASGPFVRSSYKAGENFVKSALKKLYK
ncbi:lipoyl synthase [Candidatus Woesearchaeota archaeon]|nr:lipoyl synthase [Candidatus Woesearchaeota archaeon]